MSFVPFKRSQWVAGAVALSLFYSFVSDAKPRKRTYGTEFNFSNAEIRKKFKLRVIQNGHDGQTPTELEHKFARLLKDKVQERCGGCIIIENSGGKFGFTEYKVTFQDGFYFNISVDPKVVEVQTMPATSAEIWEQKEKIDKFIFEAARDAGLKGDADDAAHFNIGVKGAFEDNPKAMLRFYVDYANRPELGLGILGKKDILNAPPVAALKPEQKQALLRLVEDNNRTPGKGDLNKLGRRINKEVHTATPKHDPWAADHYQGFSMKQFLNPHGDEDFPIEIRAIRQPTNAEEYALMAELMDKRIEYVKSQTGPIHFMPKTSPERPTTRRLAAQFYAYTEEMGDDWRRYKSILEKPVLAHLENNAVQDIMHGKINWSSKPEIAIFEDVLMKDYGFSDLAKKALLTALQDPEIPAEIKGKAIADIMLQAQIGPAQKRAVNAFMIELGGGSQDKIAQALKVPQCNIVQRLFGW